MPVLAHPLTEAAGLPVSPLAAAGMAAAISVGLALYWPTRRSRLPEGSAPEYSSWAGRLRPGQVATRAAAVVLLVVAVVAGRTGEPRELDNLAPPLVVGLAWPALVILAASLGPVWRWVDPWDGLARVVARGEASGPPPTSVLPAVVPALLWAWYLGVHPTPLEPRSVGLVLGAYSLVTVAICLAVGRPAWLSRGEFFGVFLGWLGRLPRGGLWEWQPPRGAALLLGAFAGGLLFGAIRRTELWGGLNAVPGAMAWASVGLILTSAAFGAALWGLDREAASDRSSSDRSSTDRSSLQDGAVVRAALPVVAAIAVAVGMARSRLFTALALVPRLLSDPLGRGWNLFGTAETPFPPPLSEPQVAVIQLAVLLAGLLAGMFVLARLQPRARPRGTVALTLLVCGATIPVMLTPGV